MRFARRHLKFANVAAVLALVLAMGGGAFAATHYLITSTSQISPSVLSRLHGARGPRGPRGARGRTGKTGARGKRGPRGNPGGPRGKTGPEGPAGPPGLPGVEGREGPTGQKGLRGEKGDPGASAYSPLPPGQSESGVYGMSVGARPAKIEYDAVSLPVVLAAPIASTNVKYLPAGKSTAECEKPGTAAKGFLCIYSNFPQGEGVLPQPKVLNLEAGKPEEGSGPHGFVLEWVGAPALESEATDIGTWTVTAK